MTTSAKTAAVEVLKGMYTAEAEYLAAGGPGRASFALLAPFFNPDVVLYQADTMTAWSGSSSP